MLTQKMVERTRLVQRELALIRLLLASGVVLLELPRVCVRILCGTYTEGLLRPAVGRFG